MSSQEQQVVLYELEHALPLKQPNQPNATERQIYVKRGEIYFRVSREIALAQVRRAQTNEPSQASHHTLE